MYPCGARYKTAILDRLYLFIGNLIQTKIMIFYADACHRYRFDHSAKRGRRDKQNDGKRQRHYDGTKLFAADIMIFFRHHACNAEPKRCFFRSLLRFFIGLI